MNALPLAAFPLAGKLSRSSGFALAVVMGLAFYLAAREQQAGSSAKASAKK